MFGLFAPVGKKNERYLAQIEERLKPFEQGLSEMGVNTPYYEAIYAKSGKITGLLKRKRDFIEFADQQIAQANLDYKKAVEIKLNYDQISEYANEVTDTITESTSRALKGVVSNAQKELNGSIDLFENRQFDSAQEKMDQVRNLLEQVKDLKTVFEEVEINERKLRKLDVKCDYGDRVVHQYGLGIVSTKRISQFSEFAQKMLKESRSTFDQALRKEKELREKKERLASEAKEKELREKKERLARKMARKTKAKELREKKERLAREAKEKEFREERERLAREAKEKELKEKRERLAREAKEKELREERERPAREAKEKELREKFEVFSTYFLFVKEKITCTRNEFLLRHFNKLQTILSSDGMKKVVADQAFDLYLENLTLIKDNLKKFVKIADSYPDEQQKHSFRPQSAMPNLFKTAPKSLLTLIEGCLESSNTLQEYHRSEITALNAYKLWEEHENYEFLSDEMKDLCKKIRQIDSRINNLTCSEYYELFHLITRFETRFEKNLHTSLEAVRALEFEKVSVIHKEWLDFIIHGQSLKLKSPFACLSVYSHPSGADVVLDGMRLGTTPIARLWLRRIGKVLEINKKLYEPVKRQVCLEAGEVQDVKVSLKALPGLLSVQGQPEGADVYVAGKKAGSLPLKDVPFAPGNYEIRVSAKEHRDFKKNAQIRFGENTLVQLELEAFKDGMEWIDPVTGMKFVRVSGGSFQMGSGGKDSLSHERPVHKVCLDGFFIGRCPVTQEEWEKVMGNSNNPSNFKGDRHPVVKVSWSDCQDFITKLNSRSEGSTFALPTEAQWEFAARGGNRSRGYKYSGSNDIDEVAWYDKNSGDTTHNVGGKKANELGINDMSGNVWEWCQDWYGDYTTVSAPNPEGVSSGSHRVNRGGGWFSLAHDCRSADRDYDSPDGRLSRIGFRLALSPPGQ